MKINIKETIHKINESTPEKYRNIVWTMIILTILIVVDFMIRLINRGI